MIPKRLFVINMVITSIYTIGVLSALYAGLAPEHSTTRDGIRLNQRSCDYAVGCVC